MKGTHLRGKNSYKSLREKEGERKLVIFAYPLESVFQITTTDSLTIGSGWFFGQQALRVWYFKLFGWIRKKIYVERDKYFVLSALYFGILSFCLYCINWEFVLIWLFVAYFNALVGGSHVSSLIIVELFLWPKRPMVFTLALRGFPR